MNLFEAQTDSKPYYKARAESRLKALLNKVAVGSKQYETRLRHHST